MIKRTINISKLTRIIEEWSGFSMSTKEILIKLYPYLGLSISNIQQENETNTMLVTIECAGSGKVLSYGLVISEDETISSLRKKIHELLPRYIWYDLERHKIFIGHGGPELDRIDQINNGDTLVVLPEIKDNIKIVHSFGVLSISCSPDGKILAVGSSRIGMVENGYYDYTVKLWSLEDFSIIWKLEGHSFDVCSVAFSPDNRVLASGSYDRTVKLWSTKDGSLIQTLEGHTNNVRSVVFSPDGRMLASGSYDKTVKLWHVKDGSLIRTLKGHACSISSVAFSPDGKVLASGSWDSTVKLWHVREEDGSLIRTLEGHTHNVRSVVFSPDGRMLASGSDDRTVKLWSTKDGSLIWTLKDHNTVYSVAFSPDGKVLASGSLDKTVKLWSTQDGSVIRTLEDHTYKQSVVFISNDEVLTSGSYDKIMTIWKIN